MAQMTKTFPCLELKNSCTHTVKACKLSEILHPISEELVLVDRRLSGLLNDSIGRHAYYLVRAGGKRLRPSLVLLSGKSGDYSKNINNLIDLACAIELIHTATLIHDDIIDESALRRKKPSFHLQYGMQRAILMGDYLYALASSLLTKLDDNYVMSYMALVCQQMSEGEFRESGERFKTTLSEKTYLDIANDKTASLMRACCRLGAYVSGASALAISALEEFGSNLGIAFQIMDDCLDLTGKENLVGKTLRSDLKRGACSLPVIYLSKNMRKSEFLRLLSSSKKGQVDENVISRVADIVRRTGSLEMALNKAEEYINRGLGALGESRDVSMMQEFRMLASYTLSRNR